MVADLATFKQLRIEALTTELKKKEDRIAQLETFIFELCDKDCPEDYKRVVKKDVFYNE